MQDARLLAAAYYGYPSRRLTVIGVTGTDGKTTTATLLHSILQSAGIATGLLTTISALIGDQALDTGLHVTTPTADEVQMYLAQMVDAGLTHAVVEATSHGLAQGRVNGVEVNVAVMTNVTHEHLDFHGTWEQYRRDKARLFDMAAQSDGSPVGVTGAVINAADPSVDYFREHSQGVARVINYAADGTPADVCAKRLSRPGEHPLHADWPGMVWRSSRRWLGRLTWRTRLPLRLRRAAIDDPARLASAIAEGSAACRRSWPDARITGAGLSAIADFAHTPNACAGPRSGAEHDPIRGDRGVRQRGRATAEKRRMMAEIGMELADMCVLTAEDPRTESLDAIRGNGARVARGVLRARRLARADRGGRWRLPARWRRGDVVLSCGKGHEQSMAFGTIEYPWDDREAMRRRCGQAAADPANRHRIVAQIG